MNAKLHIIVVKRFITLILCLLLLTLYSEILLVVKVFLQKSNQTQT